MPLISCLRHWIRPLERVELALDQTLVLVDTVGFISNLPHELIAAFRSTLQETAEASLLLHVIDAESHPKSGMHEVNDVLAQVVPIDPQIEIYSKIDLIEGAAPAVERSGWSDT